jgi:peptide/nickel transport system permease protein
MAAEQVLLNLELTRARQRAGVANPGSGRRRRQRVNTSPAIVVGLVLTGFILLLALLGPILVTTDPAAQDLVNRLAPPVGLGGNWAHPLGTDALGRDLLARVVAGARISMLIGVVATMVAGTIGVTLGLIAGFGGGAVDRLVSWLADVQLAVPFVIVAIALTAVLGNGIANVLLALVVTGWVGYTRVIRLQAFSFRTAPWVEAARSLGASPVRVALRHVLPNLVPVIIVLASQQVAGMILYEAALSYLGLGAGGGVITWGGMVADGQEALTKAWWVSVIPGAAIAITVLGLNSLGDWLSASRTRR